MNDETLHDLIGDIYDAAINPEQWNILVHRITEYLALDQNNRAVYKLIDGNSVAANENLLKASGDNSNFIDSAYSKQQISNVKPARTIHHQRTSKLSETLNKHFNRAYAISDKINRLDESSFALESTLRCIPIPMIIIDNQGEIVFKNGKADAYLKQSNELDISGNKIAIPQKKLQKIFIENIETAFSNKTSATMHLGMPGQGIFSSLVITPIYRETDTSAQHIAILIAEHDHQYETSFDALKSLYNISKSETRLINGLIKGYSIKEIAENHHVSISTLRSQLKSIFSKTGTSRQAELVKLILLGPNRFFDNEPAASCEPDAINKRDRANQSFKLADGRILGYAEYGDPEGKPLFGFHPLTGCRYQAHPNESILYSLGIRLIIADRPGFGLSSPRENRQYKDYPHDINELADHLQLDQFSLLSYCGGTPYAMACAVQLADRVKQMILVSPVTPHHLIDLLLGVKTHNRMLVHIATKLPNSVFQLGKIIARSLIRDPSKYFDDVIHQLCETDASALNEPEMLENFQLSLAEALVQGANEFSYEQLLLANDWGVSANQVSCDTHIWHGDADKHVPIQYAKKFVAEFKQPEFNLIEGYGHFMIYHLWKDILMDVK